MTSVSQRRGRKRTGAAQQQCPEHVHRYACYCRVSTEDQALAETIKLQIEYLRGRTELEGWPVFDFYIDDGVSGTIPLEERPEGRRMLDDASAGAFQGVLVWRLDRLGRTLKVLISAYDQLDAVSVSIRSTTEPFDTSTPFGRAMFQFLGVMAELEKATIGERLTGGRDRVARKGQYTGGPIPFGYDLDEQRRYVPSARLIEPLGMTEAEVVRQMFQRIAFEKSSLNAERLWLTQLGVPCRKRYPEARGASKAKPKTQPEIVRTDWSTSTLQTIMHNQIYKGAATIESQNGTVERPGDGLVTTDTWDAAQAALIHNQTWAKKNGKREYLLRGLVKCGLCGHSYAGTRKGQGLYYRCIADSGSLRGMGRCPGGAVSAPRLEATVWENVRAFVDDPGPYIEQAQRELRDQLADASQHEAERRSLVAELAGKEQERERVLDAYRRGWTTADECEQKLDEITGEKRLIQARLDGIRWRAEMAAATEGYLSDVGAGLAQARDQLDEIERTDHRAAKRELIELLAPRLVVHTELLGAAKVRQRKRVTLELRLAFQAESAIVNGTATPTMRNRDVTPLEVVRRVALAG